MQVTLYRDDVTLRHPVRASREEHRVRTRLFLRLDDENVTGYGEVAPQATALHGDPGVDEVVVALEGALTRLREVIAREGSLPRWARVSRLSSGSPADQAAYALLEMALLDRTLRAEQSRGESLWPARVVTPRQATVSLLDDGPWHVGEGVTRVRVKIAPGELERARVARVEALGLPILLDYNCSATSDDDVLAQVRLVQRVADVAVVEQPYAEGNVIDHARLATRLDVDLSIDEGIRSARDLRHVANYHAARVVCVKPARVGGLANARTLIALAGELGLRAYLGGFFESPFARRVHRVLANAFVTEPSDLDDVVTAKGDEEVVRDPYGFGVVPAPAMLAGAAVLSSTR